MGRVFEEEIKHLPGTIERCFSRTLPSQLGDMISSLLPFPLLVVGSGGSLSGAHFIARLHEQVTGQMARAMTPLDLVFSDVAPAGHAVLFLTASGSNKDILRAVDIAIQREFAASAIFCARIGSKVHERTKANGHIGFFEYANPAGKDGFLAVNSLLSTCILAARAYGAVSEDAEFIKRFSNEIPDFSTIEWHEALSRKTLVAIGGGWAWPALADLESKVSEAALGNISVSDLRNFGHGRHNWFGKRGDESALLVFETPPLAQLAKKTLELLPSVYPRALLRSSFDGPWAGIDLLVQVFHLVAMMGKRAGIDPGRPKVPEFGRKIYHLGLYPVVRSCKTANRNIWVNRKSKATGLPTSIAADWLERFLVQLRSGRFAGVVLDYDGTLCDPRERFTAPSREMGLALNRLLAEGISVAVATGRGRSVQESLRKVIDHSYWAQVIVGNHNGSVILPLTEDPPLFNEKNLSDIIREAHDILSKEIILNHYRAVLETRERQISICSVPPFPLSLILEVVLDRLHGLAGIKIRQSDHSIDIIDPQVSKVLVVERIRKDLSQGHCDNILVVGDQGHQRGNDSEMLTEPFSLSVDKVSSSLLTCWNLSPAGVRGAKATLSILKAIRIGEGYFQMDTDALEKEEAG